jgi:hypothetical protein
MRLLTALGISREDGPMRRSIGAVVVLGLGLSVFPLAVAAQDAKAGSRPWMAPYTFDRRVARARYAGHRGRSGIR